MSVQRFEAGQTWMWQARHQPEAWVVWCVLMTRGEGLHVLTLASGDFEEKTTSDEPGAVYWISARCIMAETSKRVT